MVMVSLCILSTARTGEREKNNAGTALVSIYERYGSVQAGNQQFSRRKIKMSRSSC